MTELERRIVAGIDRRHASRGGRRDSDRPGRHPTVLIADCYEDARAPLARYLDRFGFDVREAASGEEAVDALDRLRPEVVLSGLGGSQAHALFHALSDGRAAPTVVMVLLSAIDDPVPARATGFMTKPFSLGPLLDELRRQIRAIGAARRPFES